MYYSLKIAMLEWVHFVKSNPPYREGPEHTPFTNAIRLKMVRGVPVYLKNFVIDLFLVPDLRVGNTAV